MPPGVLLTRSSLKHFRLYFAKLFPFFFFLQVTAKWKSLSLPKLQALSPLFKNTTIFFFLYAISFCTTAGRGSCNAQQRVSCPGKGFAHPAPCHSYQEMLLWQQHLVQADAACAASPRCRSPSAAWMLQQITAAVQEQACSHMLLLTSIY